MATGHRAWWKTAVVPIVAGDIGEPVTWLVRPPEPITWQADQIHRITTPRLPTCLASPPTSGRTSARRRPWTWRSW